MSTYGYLAHHGIQGQKWGVRRYQNADGSLTAAGYRRYYGNMKDMSKEERKQWKTAMDMDRSKWSKDAKAAYKAAKAKVRSGELSKESKEFQKAKADRTMAGAKASKLAAYRFGTAEEKEEALKSRKKAKAATTAALATTGALTLVGAAALVDAGAKATATAIATTGTVGAGVGAVGAAGLFSGIRRAADYKMHNSDNADGSVTTMGTGSNTVMRINPSKLEKDKKGRIIDPEGQKNRIIKEFTNDVQRSVNTYNVEKENPYTKDRDYDKNIKEGFFKRLDSEYDNLMELGYNKNEIDDMFAKAVNDTRFVNENNSDYNYNERHKDKVYGPWR